MLPREEGLSATAHEFCSYKSADRQSGGGILNGDKDPFGSDITQSCILKIALASKEVPLDKNLLYTLHT
jgi:hypothetical protein